LERNEKQLLSQNAAGERQWYVNTQKQTFAILNAGDFLMGSPESDPDHFADESQHRVRIGRRFAISTHEVTKVQYADFQLSTKAADDEGEDRSERARRKNRPENAMTWYEAAQYCNWLSEKEGILKEQWCYEPNKDGKYAAGMRAKADHTRLIGYRLPTEAEWEYACRAGTETSRYYGMSDNLLPQYAWYQANSRNEIHPIGQLKPNDWGLFDMLGNVMEWCFDLKLDYPDRKDVVRNDNPTRQSFQDRDGCVLRGGRYFDVAEEVRSPYREVLKAIDENMPVGFRPARTYQ